MRRIWLLTLLMVAHCALPRARVSLPLDEGRHAEPVEWWYWSGHLATPEGQRFGFQMTFFVFDGAVLVDNAALTDIDAHKHHSAQGSQPLNGDDLVRGMTRASGTNGTYELAATFEDTSFSLSTTPGPLILHDQDGHLPLPLGGSTYYYSRPRLPVAGSVTIAATTHTVTGSAWFDHQWGELGPAIAAGWDWFGVQFDDGRELMLYVFDPRGTRHMVGTWSGTDGVSRIDQAEVSVRSTGQWTSPDSGCTYPLGWQIVIGDFSLDVAPALDEQEIVPAHDPTASYWEGAAVVSGEATGRAYVELAGYCR